MRNNLCFLFWNKRSYINLKRSIHPFSKIFALNDKKKPFWNKKCKKCVFSKNVWQKKPDLVSFQKMVDKKRVVSFQKKGCIFSKKKAFFLFTFFVYFLKQKMQSLCLFKKLFFVNHFLKRHKLCIFWKDTNFAFFVSNSIRDGYKKTLFIMPPWRNW